MNYNNLEELKSFFVLNQTEENKIKANDIDFLTQLKPKEFLCPICKKWHKWEGDSLQNLFNNNLPYYYMCNNSENTINIKDTLEIYSSNTHVLAFELESHKFNISELFRFTCFHLFDNILLFYDNKILGNRINIFALKFDKEDIENITNIKNIYESIKKPCFKTPMEFLNPIEFICPICGKLHTWNGEALSKYTFDRPYKYVCSFTKAKVKLFIFKYALYIIASQLPNNIKFKDVNKNGKLYIIKHLNYFKEEHIACGDKEISNLFYSSYSIYKNENYHISFKYNKNDIEELNHHKYLNTLHKKSYKDVKLPFNPDIFKLVPIKFLCPVCGKWHKFKTNYLFQSKINFFKVYYEELCPNTNSIITIIKDFSEQYSYTILAKNIYKFLDSDTISILNFKKDDILPRIYGTLYLSNLNGKTTFVLEFDENEFKDIIEKEPKYDITNYDNAIKQSYIIPTPYGIGTYDETYAYIYDRVKKCVVHYKYYADCENYLYLGNGTNENIQKVPVPKSDLEIGDSIYYDKKLYFVHEINVDYSIIVMDPFTGKTINIAPYVSKNGNKYYIKLFMLSDIPEYTLSKLWNKYN